jgi:hypothetical protein
MELHYDQAEGFDGVYGWTRDPGSGIVGVVTLELVEIWAEG